MYKKIATDPRCLYCQDAQDDAEHSLFECRHFKRSREGIVSLLGRRPKAEDVTRILCGDPGIAILQNAGLQQYIQERGIEMSRKFMEMVDDCSITKEAFNHNTSLVISVTTCVADNGADRIVLPLLSQDLRV